MLAPHFSVSGRLPEPNLVAVLIAAGFATNVARWVHSQMRIGPYTHYTVTQEQCGTQTVLSIDTFLLDLWVNSRTGATGKSPHGSCEEFVLDADGNVVTDCGDIDADGIETHWISRSISFYG